MKINIRNFLKNNSRRKGAFDELINHLEELAGRYYQGDIAVVDEFLELYCLDNKKPKDEKARAGK